MKNFKLSPTGIATAAVFSAALLVSTSASAEYREKLCRTYFASNVNSYFCQTAPLWVKRGDVITYQAYIWNPAGSIYTSTVRLLKDTTRGTIEIAKTSSTEITGAKNYTPVADGNYRSRVNVTFSNKAGATAVGAQISAGW